MRVKALRASQDVVRIHGDRVENHDNRNEISPDRGEIRDGRTAKRARPARIRSISPEITARRAEVAHEMRQLVRAIAAPFESGESVKTQIRRAWDRLGHPGGNDDFWRVAEAWRGKAQRWESARVELYRQRYRAWRGGSP